ncbi:MAG: DUF5689 domain-containing protein [Rikenellaceae bacterium]
MPKFHTVFGTVTRAVFGAVTRAVFGAVTRVLLTCVAALVVSGCYDQFGEIEVSEGEDLTVNITIKELQTKMAASGYVDIDQDIRVRGYVSAHDKGGNFYKCFAIESGGYGLEILEGLTDSYVRHQLGAEIVVQLDGLRLSRSRGVVQVGVAAAESSYYDLDYIGHEYIVDQYITNTGYTEEVEPREFTLAELAADPELATELCGSLIKVTGLRYYTTDEDDDGLWSGERCFIDAADPLFEDTPEATIYCYTSDYAAFSAQSIPTEMGSITGILQGDDVTGGEGYEMLIKPRDNSDFNF